MQSIDCHDARETLDALLDQVSKERAPLEVTRPGKGSVIIIDKRDYEGMMETIHLLSSPANAGRLLAAAVDAIPGCHFSHQPLID